MKAMADRIWRGGVAVVFAMMCGGLFAQAEPERVLFYPTVLKATSNLVERAKWRPPRKESCRVANLAGGPFRADEPAWQVESLQPESAYWRTYARLQPGHVYLVGAWVRYTNAKILFWCHGRQVDGKPFNQRLYCFGGFQSYLTPYMSEELRRKLDGDPNEWKLLFRRLECPVALERDTMCLAFGIYMATGSMVFSAPFLVDVTARADRSLTIDIAAARPIRRLAVEHVGERDMVWQRDFREPVTAFREAVADVTDYRRGMDNPRRIDGHALNVFYVDGTAAKVFAPQENVFMER